MKRSTGLQSNQQGIVSIMVTLIIMIVLSLVVLGFARIMRREQRQSLDYQLSTQAFYAAESGINDAVRAIKGGYSSKKTDCATPPSSSDFPTGSEVAPGVSYSCLLIDPTPLELVYDNIDIAKSTVVPMKAAGADPFTSVTISWQAKDAGGSPSVDSCPDLGEFRPAANWPTNGCDAGVLRVDLVPSDGPLDRAMLASSTMTAFLYPRPGSATPLNYNDAIGFGGQGAIVKGDCTDGGARRCKVTITGLSRTGYHLRLKSIYKPSAVTVTATSAIGPIPLAGAQAVVDSTGKANDILRRIQVRVPLHRAIAPEALESVNTLCKRMKVAPGIDPIFDPISCSP
jgi:hypothetical protein